MNPLQRGHEFIGQFATDAPAFQFHVPWACLISQQGLIDSQLPEFVRHDRDSHTLRLCLFKQVAHERGFPCTQKSGHDQRRHVVSGDRHVACRGLVLKR